MILSATAQPSGVPPNVVPCVPGRIEKEQLSSREPDGRALGSLDHASRRHGQDLAVDAARFHLAVDGDGGIDEALRHTDPESADIAFQQERGYGYAVSEVEPTPDGRASGRKRAVAVLNDATLPCTVDLPDGPSPPPLSQLSL